MISKLNEIMYGDSRPRDSSDACALWHQDSFVCLRAMLALDLIAHSQSPQSSSSSTGGGGRGADGGSTAGAPMATLGASGKSPSSSNVSEPMMENSSDAAAEEAELQEPVCADPVL